MTKQRRSAWNPPGSRKNRAVEILTWEYNSNPQFVEEFASLVQNERPTLQLMSEGSFWPPFGSLEVGIGRLSDWHPARDSARSADQLRCEGVLEQAKSLASRWGLKAAWSPPLVLRVAIDNVRSLAEEPLFLFNYQPGWFEPLKDIDLTPLWESIGTVPEGLPSSVAGPRNVVLLALEYIPAAENRPAFESRLLSKARSAMDEIEQDLRHSVGLERANPRSELNRHVRWLYLAICPDPHNAGWPLTNDKIAERESVVEETTVSKAVNNLARMLKIQLKRPPGPRPKP